MSRTWIRTLVGVTVTGTALLIAGAASANYMTIAIDGDFSDWSGVPLSHSDPVNADPTVVDYKDIYVANDDDYLYIRFTLHKPDDPFTFLGNIFIDADNNGLTGFDAGGYVGSEMLIQGGAGYQEKNGGFNEGGINGLDWSAAPGGVGTEFELRISRAATYASDGLAVFANPTIALVLEADNSGFASVEWAPATPGGIEYTLAAIPEPTTLALLLVGGLGMAARRRRN